MGNPENLICWEKCVVVITVKLFKFMYTIYRTIRPQVVPIYAQRANEVTFGQKVTSFSLCCVQLMTNFNSAGAE